MNTNVQISISSLTSNLARVAFSIFIHIADVDKNITPQEVRRFQMLLRETAWVDNDDLRDALFELQQHYSTFWAHYEDGVFPVNVGSIAEGVGRAIQELSEERGMSLRRALVRFLKRLDSGSYSVKLVGSSDHKARQQARKDIGAILQRSEGADLQLRSLSIPAPAQVLLPIAWASNGPEVEPVGAIPTNTNAAATAGETINSFSANLAQPSVTQTTAEVVADATASPETRPIHLWPVAALSPDEIPVWKGGKTKVRCSSVVWETDDTKTYSFVAEPRMLFHFKPGQFVTLEVPMSGSVLKRCYTISSSPSRPYMLSITVKKVPMGWMSNWLFDNMAEGFECYVTGPVGKFTCHDHPSEKLLFLSAGSGITPIISMLRWLADTASSADIILINNVRTPDDIIFHQELLHLSTRFGGRMRLAIVPAAVSPSRPWFGTSGRLDELLIRACAPDFAERETFVCGPAGYMVMAKQMLAGMGTPIERYHEESFGGAQVPVSAPVVTMPLAPQPVAHVTAQPPTKPARALTSAAAAAQAPGLAVGLAEYPVKTMLESARVSLAGSSNSFVVPQGRTILDAADTAGVNIRHSCRSGICGACKMLKTSGSVSMDEQSVLSQADIDAGYILTCVSRAVGNVTLSP